MLALIVIILLVVIFMIGYTGNLATKRPDGCEQLDECHSCSTISCSHHPSQKEEL